GEEHRREQDEVDYRAQRLLLAEQQCRRVGYDGESAAQQDCEDVEKYHSCDSVLEMGTEAPGHDENDGGLYESHDDLLPEPAQYQRGAPGGQGEQPVDDTVVDVADHRGAVDSAAEQGRHDHD